MVEDGDWYVADSRGVRIFALIGHKLYSHLKVDASHGVLSVIFGTHCLKS